MARCRVDPELKRTVVEGFAFPLGVYPVEPMKPAPGYSVEFEAADSGQDSEFEEWPDRYVYEIVISADRLESLCRSLFALVTTLGSGNGGGGGGGGGGREDGRGVGGGAGGGRVYPILDYLGHDQYREVDPYISYELMGIDRILDGIRRYRGFFYEDGLCGFGVMTDDPFLYIFVNEHKVVTVRCEPHRREKVERILQAFDLEQVAEPAAADAADHEHRTVLVTAEDRPDLLTADEIVEDLRDEWNLVLNVDPETNLDEEGNELGITPWRCLVRVISDPVMELEGEGSGGPARPSGSEAMERVRYADVVLTAASLHAAEDLALDAVDQLSMQKPAGGSANGGAEETEEWDEAAVVFADRIRPEMLIEFLREHGETRPEKSLRDERIIWTGWLE